MRLASLHEIYKAPHLTGFSQFTSGAHTYLVVLEKNSENTQSRLTLFQANEGRFQTLKVISDEDVSIRAIDGVPQGTDFVFGLELNGTTAMAVVRAPLSALLDPKSKTLNFKPDTEIELSESQAKKVNLPVKAWWNVATPLPPSQWLFSPRFVRGGGDGWQLIANTADGQAMLFSPPSRTDLLSFSISNAAEPQACMVNRQRVVAFKRYAETHYPFWSLERYSGDSLPKAFDLMVSTDPSSIRNLSRELSLGAIIGYALAATPQGRLWIFALIDAPVGTDVVALSYDGKNWTQQERWPIDGEFINISAEYTGSDQWRLVYGGTTASGWALYHQVWRSS